MGTDKKRLNLTLSNGLLITHAQKHRSGVYVLFITDLQATGRVIFDGDKVCGKYGFNVSDKDNVAVKESVGKAFAT